MKIATGPFSQAEWNSIVENFADLNLLQTWEYAEASSRVSFLKSMATSSALPRHLSGQFHSAKAALSSLTAVRYGNVVRQILAN